MVNHTVGWGEGCPTIFFPGKSIEDLPHNPGTDRGPGNPSYRVTWEDIEKVPGGISHFSGRVEIDVQGQMPDRATMIRGIDFVVVNTERYREGVSVSSSMCGVKPDVRHVDVDLDTAPVKETWNPPQSKIDNRLFVTASNPAVVSVSSLTKKDVTWYVVLKWRNEADQNGETRVPRGDGAFRTVAHGDSSLYELQNDGTYVRQD